jgi:predicted RNA binding protein YcfA (HicA-like mRNA interferase family)
MAMFTVTHALGYQLDRQRGSHAIYKDGSGRRVVVPMHSGKDLKPGTLGGMMKDVGLEKNEFFQRLRDL